MGPGATFRLPGEDETSARRLDLNRGQSAILIENTFEFVGNIGRFPMLNIAALNHVYQFAIAEERNGRRGRRIPSKVPASTFRRFDILAGKNREHVARTVRVLQRGANGRTHTTSGASAN